MLNNQGNSMAGPDLAVLIEDLLQAGETELYRRVLLEVDRAVFTIVLERVGGNQVQASRLLGISRSTLRAKLRALREATQDQRKT
jgi:two-component system nitrogen regulation response regulator GlnG